MCSSSKKRIVSVVPIFIRYNFKFTECYILLMMADDLTFTCHILRSMMSILNSVSKGFGPFFRPGSSRQFQRPHNSFVSFKSESLYLVLWSGLKEKSIPLKPWFTWGIVVSVFTSPFDECARILID